MPGLFEVNHGKPDIVNAVRETVLVDGHSIEAACSNPLLAIKTALNVELSI